MCGFFPFTPLPCSQPCLQLHFGLGVRSLLWEPPQQDVPDAQVQPTRGVPATMSQTCPKRVPNVSQTPWQWLWGCGTGSGVCWEGAAGQPQPQLPSPAAGNGASRGWGRSWCHWVDLGPTHTRAQPHRGHEGDDGHLPLCTLQHLLPSALTGVVAADLLLPAVGRGWDGAWSFRKVTVFWCSNPSPVTLFPQYFFV